MDLGWKRVHLFIFLTFLKYAVGSEGWILQNDQAQQDWPAHKRFSRGLQSSVLEAPATGSIPSEEVVPGKSSLMLTASSLKSSGLQTSRNTNPLSAPSSSSTGSLGSYRSLSTSTYQGSSDPQMTGFRKLVSTSGLVAQSPSTGSKNVPGLLYARFPTSPLGFSHTPSGQSSYTPYTSTSQSSVGTPLKDSLQYVPGPGSSSGASVQPQATSSQYAPALSFGGKLPVSSQYSQAAQRVSLSPSQSFQKWQPSTSRTQGFQASSTVLKGSDTSQRGSWSPSKFPLPSSAGGSISSSVQSPGTSSQKGPVPLDAKVSVYSQAAPTSLSLSQPSQWQPSSSRYVIPGSSLLDFSSQSASGPSSSKQYTPSTQSKVGTQLPGSSPFVPVNPPGGSSSLQPQGTASLYAPAFFGAKLPVSSQTAPSGSLSLSQLSPWRPLSRLSQSFQTSGGVGSKSSSSSQVSRDPSKASTLTSVASPTQFVSTPEGSGRYSEMSMLSQSGSSSQNMADTPLAGSKKQTGLYAIGSPLQLQGTSSQKSPAAFDAKVPVYSQVSALSQTSLWKPSTSRWSQGFPASGTVASDSSSPSQSSKDPSRFPTITLAANPSQFASAQKGSGRYSGMPKPSPSLSNPYIVLNAKLSASPLSVSPSTSGQGSYSQYTSSSQSRDGTLSSLQLQGTSNLYDPSRQSAKVPVNRLAAPSRPSFSQSQQPKWQTSSSWSKGFQTSGTVALQSGSPSQGSKALSRFPTLGFAASTSQFASMQGRGDYSGLSRLSQDPSIPGSPAYAKHGSSGLYVSNLQSKAGTQLADSNRYVPAQTGSTPTGASLKIHSCNHHDPTVTCQCNNASQSGSPLTGSVASQSSSSPQSSKSSIPSSPTSSFFGVGLKPAKLSAQAAAGSTIGSQTLPGASASVQYPSDFMTSSLGSSVQGDSQGGLSGQSSDSTVLSSSYGYIYGQKASGYSQGFPTEG